jgi:hypothetical protein
MRIDYRGYVGIGTTNPQARLEVRGNGPAGSPLRLVSGFASAEVGIGFYRNPDQTQVTNGDLWVVGQGSWGVGDRNFGIGCNGQNLVMSMLANGRVGIGITNPSYPLQVASTSILASGSYKFFNSGSTTLASSTQAYCSIYAGSSIVAADAIVASDMRIKKLEDPLESFLDIVDKLQVHRYSYIDQVTKHSDKQIGFFAQEVKEILPGAVKFTDGIVPTIYKEATSFTSNTITVPQHGLNVGSQIQVYSYITDDNVIEVLADVTAIIDENSFEVKTTTPLGGTRLFIFGEKVNDFHNLNYDYVSSVGFGGLKELHALVKAQQTTIEMLTERLAALEARA